MSKPEWMREREKATETEFLTLKNGRNLVIFDLNIIPEEVDGTLGKDKDGNPTKRAQYTLKTCTPINQKPMKLNVGKGTERKLLPFFEQGINEVVIIKQGEGTATKYNVEIPTK
jgi:hypothetical protein